MSRNPQAHRPSGQSGPVLFVFGLITGLLFALFTDAYLRRLRKPDDLVLLGQVHDLAMAEYVSEVDSRQLMDDALDGMLQGLDSHSRFYPSSEVESIDRETTGEFRGIGVIFRQPVSDGQVLFPFPGSPADRAGLRVGDRLLEVHGQEVAGLEPKGLQELLKSKGGAQVPVRVERLDGSQERLEIRPEKVTDPTVRHAHMIDTELGLGYLAILSFTHATANEFAVAVLALKSMGLKSLIIDLRFNPGGILESAVKIANRFVPDGPLVSRESRSEVEVSMADPEKAIFEGMPLVLLVNGASASASEILSGALQDHGVATLVGVATYGKGTVQTLRKLANNRGILKFTTAKYYTPAHRSIERIEGDREASGIAPELHIQVSAQERNAVHQYLARYSPPLAILPSVEAWEQEAQLQLLPDAPADAQLEAAILLLSGLAPDAQLQEALGE